MPLIALSPSWDEKGKRLVMGEDYLNAVLRAGGTPLVVSLSDSLQAVKEALGAADALILTGGADVNPALYGEEKQPFCGEIAPERDRAEYALTRCALEMRLPILAICRGMQVLNCFLGGSLYQDIASQYSQTLTHPRYEIPRSDVHAIRYAPDSLLRQVVGLDTSMVNSRHHQGVKALAPGMRAVAFAPDGLIEGMESADGAPVLGVQWHPEALEDRLPEQRRLFAWLIREASR